MSRGFATPTRRRGAPRSIKAACSSTAAGRRPSSSSPRVTSSSSIGRRGRSPRRQSRSRSHSRTSTCSWSSSRRACRCCPRGRSRRARCCRSCARATRRASGPRPRIGSGAARRGSSRSARLRSAAPRSTRQLRDFTFGKTYLAWVAGERLPDSFAARQPIARIAHGPLTIHAAAAHGRPSLTRVRVLRREAERTLVAAQPITGRPDQIRIHLAAAGAPIVGDPLFGPGGVPISDAPPGAGGYLLHAVRLSFTHPTSGARIRLQKLARLVAAVMRSRFVVRPEIQEQDEQSFMNASDVSGLSESWLLARAACDTRATSPVPREPRRPRRPSRSRAPRAVPSRGSRPAATARRS